jgi:hypothetical protein
VREPCRGRDLVANLGILGLRILGQLLHEWGSASHRLLVMARSGDDAVAGFDPDAGAAARLLSACRWRGAW